MAVERLSTALFDGAGRQVNRHLGTVQLKLKRGQIVLGAELPN